ncbi:MAG: phenylalanine--tRNA ligase subunit beta [Chlorobi bacterium]|nr:phenylalanine--tRNA ligase subunit beta [Chlorobiota bacterium]MBX7215479.1 phenylalanine--tRNA ligase subunit beta [Candidatus Kapabacteria bacterium]
MPTRRVAESWLQSITPYQFSPTELCDRLLQLGLEVTVAENRRESLAPFVVGQVLTREQHPNADRLSLCTVSTGAETFQVVCGAPNVAAGQKIAFAPIGAFIHTAGFTIEKRKIRGVESQGMICSEQELGLGEGHDGILVLPDDAQVGTPLADLLGEVIYDVDITPNRADCLGHTGLAREISALTGNPVHWPTPQISESESPASGAISIRIEDPELCPRYSARVVRGVRIGPSPEWLQSLLRKLGVRPRNNVVDVANYVMFECGHPLHAFDLDTIAGQQIVVRAVSGQKFTTLDSKEQTLPDNALMICDAEKPVAIAGIMGGENSEITDATVNVLIESAYFNPSSIRRTARKLGLATDASYRFERGADVEITLYAVNRAAQLIAQLAGGEILAGVVDEYPLPHTPQTIQLRYARTVEILGVELGGPDQAALLRRLGFGVAESENGADVTVPSYRVDIYGEIDLIEEIGRLYGCDNIPEDTRAPISMDTSEDPLLKTIAETRRFLVDNGFAEIVGLHLTSPEIAAQFGNPVHLKNSLGRDTSAMRTSLAPTLANVAGLNERHSRPDQKLFEIGKAFRRSQSGKGVIPGFVEMTELGALISGAAEPSGWDTPARQFDLFDLRAAAERLLGRLSVREATFAPVEVPQWGIGAPALAIHIGGQEVGRMGPLDASAAKHYDLLKQPFLLLLDLELVANHAFQQNSYRAPSRFPVVHRDIAVILPAAVPNGAVESTIRVAGGALLSGLRLFDLYQGKGIEPTEKSLAYSISFTSHDQTLEDAEIERVMGQIVAAVSAEHGARLRQ